jgi:hypothetical protein
LPLKYVFPSPLAIAKLLDDYFDIRGYGTNNTFQLINASINLRTECLKRERRRGPNKKKICEFIINGANSVRKIPVTRGKEITALLKNCLVNARDLLQAFGTFLAPFFLVTNLL